MAAIRCACLTLLAAAANAVPVVRPTSGDSLVLSAEAHVQAAALEAVSMGQLKQSIASAATQSFGYATTAEIEDSHRRLQSG